MKSEPKSSDQLPHVIEQYITKRCLTAADLKLLKIELITGAEGTLRLGLGKALTDKYAAWPWALYMPGWRSDGSINDSYGQAVFFNEQGGRARLSGSKYRHPTDAIFMPIGKPYAELGSNSTIYICESFFKAAVLTLRLGVPAVALNGVSGWSRGNGVLNAGLSEPWWGNKHMRAVVIFDSLSRDPTSSSKRNVTKARKSVLTRMLEAQSILGKSLDAQYVELPPPPEALKLDQWGLDDFASHHGLDKLREVIHPDHFQDEKSASREGAIGEFNSRYVWVKGFDKAYDLSQCCFYSKQNLFNNEENNIFWEKDGDKWKAVQVAKAWMSHPDRQTVEKVAFLPGEAAIIDGDLNLWTGFAAKKATGAEALQRAQKYWADVIHETFPDGGDHLIKMLAYRHQYPHRRLMAYIYVYGRFGTSKNYIFNVLQEIAGSKQFPSLTPNNYIQQFNGSKLTAWGMLINELPQVMTKQEIALMEVELRLDSDPAQKARPVEPKGKEILQTNRNALVICISNYDPCWPIMYGDRRTFALHSSDHMAIHKPDRPWGSKTQEWWDERWAWMRQTGAEDVLAYLLSLDVSDFNPEGEPPETAYKRELAANGKRGFESWLGELHVKPEAIEERLGLEVGILKYVTTEAVALMFALDTHTKLDNMRSAGQKVGKELGQEARKIQVWNGATEKNEVKRVWRLRGRGVPTTLSDKEVMALEKKAASAICSLGTP